MIKVYSPNKMNETFALAFNSRNIDDLICLYEPDAILISDKSGKQVRGAESIAIALSKLLQLSGTMVSHNNFCVIHGELALLRADFLIRDGDIIIATGSTSELIRRQIDGSWLYVIDHASGASLPKV